MPWIAFVDEELSQEMNRKIKTKGNVAKETFPEHEFLASCLRIGLNLNDLIELTYIDCMKILLSYIGNNNNVREATQKDIDKLLK